MKEFNFHLGSTLYGINTKMVNGVIHHLGHISNLDKAKNKAYKIPQESLRLINQELKAQLNINSDKEPKPKKEKKIKPPKEESKFLRCGCRKGDYCYCGSNTPGIIDY